MRERRGTGLGGAGSRVTTRNPKMDEKAKVALLKLEMFLDGTRGKLVNPGPGVAKIDCGHGRVIRYSTSEVHALERRGWVTLSAWRAQGFRYIALTKKGRKTCPPRPRYQFKPRLPHP